MADYTLTTDQTGIYEIPIGAGSIVTVAVPADTAFKLSRFQVIVNSADTPVYVKPGTAVAVKDRTSAQVVSGSWLDLDPTWSDTGQTIALTCASDAIVSVART